MQFQCKKFKSLNFTKTVSCKFLDWQWKLSNFSFFDLSKIRGEIVFVMEKRNPTKNKLTCQRTEVILMSFCLCCDLIVLVAININFSSLLARILLLSTSAFISAWPQNVIANKFEEIFPDVIELFHFLKNFHFKK